MRKTYEIPTFLKDTPSQHPLTVDFISSLADAKIEGSSVFLTCNTLRFHPQIHDFYGTKCEVTFDAGVPGEPFAVRLDFCTPEIMRFRAHPGREIPENITPMVVGKFEKGVKLTFREAEDRLILTTTALTVEIFRAPWQIVVSDHNGGRILATSPVDIEPLRRPAVQWNPPQERWLFLHRYAYPMGVQRGDHQASFASFELQHDEHIYGLGEDFGRLDKRNIQRQLWLQEGFGNASPASYKQTPFYMSTNGYGLYNNTSHAISYNIGSLEHTTLSTLVENTHLTDFYLIYGPELKDILPRYTQITGKPGMPPPWSFGLWMGRITYNSQSQVEQVAKDLRAHNIPCDVIHIDTGWFKEEWVCDLQFDSERFPDVKKMLKDLHHQGFHVCVWQLPLLVIESSLFEEAAQNGYLVKRKNGAAYLSTGFLSDAGLIDYSNPKAVHWIKQKFTDLFELGVDVIKADFGEGAPPDGVYDSLPGETMHNLFPLLYNKAVFEATEDFYGEGQALIWGRSAWAGSQRYPLHWSGDGIARHQDLPCVVRSALNMGLSGFPFYSHDVGGFSGLPSPELYIRWIQLGAFSSHVRCHGQPPREPWAYGPQTEALFRRYMDLRYRLMPYIYSEALACVQSSLPMLRALVLEYQHDPTTYTIEDQYLFGRSILVAPILSNHEKRKVYLPAGNWIEYWQKTQLKGPAWIEIEAPLETLPLYVKSGSILPYGPALQHIGEKACDPLTLEIYTPEGNQEYTVHDPVFGAIPIAYQCEDDQVIVTSGAAPGKITILLYGVQIESATLDGEKTLSIEKVKQSGWQVSFNGQKPHKITFQVAQP